MSEEKKKMITPEFRGSFVALAEPKAAPGATVEKYSIQVVLKEDADETQEFLKSLKVLMDAAAKEKFGKVPKSLKTPIRSGDDEDREEVEGCIFFNVANRFRPSVVGPDLKPVLDPDILYSGAYYRVQVSAFAWEHKTGGKGVSLNLDSVMWVKDGERFGGGASDADAADAFASYKQQSNEVQDELEFDD